LIKAEPELANTARGVISKQLVACVLIALSFLLQGQWHALSALYGGLISISTALLLSRGVARASKAAATDPQKSMAILYVGAVQRFLLVLGFFALGLAIFKLDPLAVTVSFGVTQVTFVLASRIHDKSIKNKST
jgi:ATP synthase protein I